MLNYSIVLILIKIILVTADVSIEKNLSNSSSSSLSISNAEQLTLDYLVSFSEADKLLFDLDQLIETLIHTNSNTNTVKSSSIPNARRDGDGPEQTELKSETLNNQFFDPSKTKDLVSYDVRSRKNNPDQIITLIDNLSDLDRKLQVTFQDLQLRRRFVLGAMIRQMQNTVRRIRSNVYRIQTTLNAAGNVATQPPLISIRPILQIVSVPTESTSQTLQSNKEIVEQIHERIDSVSSKISEIVTRLNISLDVPPPKIESNEPLKKPLPKL
ncbi:hypothetical protein SSS_10621 [Sarcoptes scabiei]|uniref:Uncharacterized protein n=1 Tax=Sarcoptes scabiei TaxID=52283 RepID=A0A834R2T4_SARSC|nr:hypothetical protein SSS_10621 [Sarcoptes scabiei]